MYQVWEVDGTAQCQRKDTDRARTIIDSVLFDGGQRRGGGDMKSQQSLSQGDSREGGDRARK